MGRGTTYAGVVDPDLESDVAHFVLGVKLVRDQGALGALGHGLADVKLVGLLERALLLGRQVKVLATDCGDDNVRRVVVVHAHMQTVGGDSVEYL